MILLKGIASIFVDDEYITKENASEKLIIIDDMINLLCFITNLERSIIRALVIKEN